jgi:hypothetical protein
MYRIYDKERLKVLAPGGFPNPLSNPGYSEILADLPGKEVSYLGVSWHGGSFIQFGIPPS